MPVVACPCGKKFRAIDALAGKQVKCPGCGRPLTIPNVSLLDEELARSVRQPAAAASQPRSHVRGRNINTEVWLLAALVVVGVVVVLAIVVTASSMFQEQANPRADDKAAAISQTEDKTPGSLADHRSPDANPSLARRQLEAGSSSAPRDTSADTDSLPSDEEPLLEEDEPDSDLADEPPDDDPLALPADTGHDEPPPRPGRPVGSASQPTENSIRLSAGVALAQSLPTGTAMGFSVDYEVMSRSPSGSANFIWVIESKKGQTLKQPVRLQARGTLQGFFPPLRPEHGPFSTHIEDQNGNRLSKAISMR